MEKLIFYILAAAALGGGLNMVFRRNPVVAALNFVVTLLALAGLYLSLGAEFLAVIQVIVYAGAIMVLFLFVIFLVDVDKVSVGRIAPFRFPVPILTLLLGAVWAAVVAGSELPAFGTISEQGGTGKSVGEALFTRFVFPFETVSVILLAAMIGAVVLAKKRSVE